MKTSNLIRKAVTYTIGLTLIICMAMMAGCKKENSMATALATKADAAEAPVDTFMKAPEIGVDRNGFVTLANCPFSDDHLRVDVNEEGTSIQIFYDDKEMQTVTDEDGLVAPRGDECPVYFLDANFDGYTDIFVGPGESRTYSTLLLWDASAKEFKRVGKLGEPSLQNFTLHPETKMVYEGGSNSWCNVSYSKSTWENGQLKCLEELTVISDSKEYAANGVKNQYTLRTADGKDIKSTEQASELPGQWRYLLD